MIKEFVNALPLNGQVLADWMSVGFMSTESVPKIHCNISLYE